MKDYKKKIRVLLIEDDEDDYLLVKHLLSEIDYSPYLLDWESAYDTGLDKICRGSHDVYLLDYFLGKQTGLELMREAIDRGCLAPIILLTGQGGYEVDVEALNIGAADFISKQEMTGSLLDHSIRYAIAQRKTMNDLRESESRCRLLSSQLLSAQEKERRVIARDIHDSIGSSLAAIKFKVESVLIKMEEVHSSFFEPLKNIIPFIQEAIEEARRIQMNLRPSILDDFGILSTIGWVCRQFSSTHPEISFNQEIDITEDEVPGALKIVIFRVLQEALNNIAKHSRATRVIVALERKNQHIGLAVRDNGVGFDLKEKLQSLRDVRGLGLESMMERVELSGGTFTVVSTSKGTTLEANWPLEITLDVSAPWGRLMSSY